jgi:hypothetical protein
MDCLLRVLLTTIVIARKIPPVLAVRRSIHLRALHQLSSSFVGGFAGGLPFVGVLFSGFTPCLEERRFGDHIDKLVVFVEWPGYIHPDHTNAILRGLLGITRRI